MPANRLASLDGFRALELHEALAHARPPRAARDLGDAVLLHDPDDPDPFLNRVSGLRLPADEAAFDRRLAELLALFGSLGRRPHIWPAATGGTPPDLVVRLSADGFADLGGTFWMVLPDPGALRSAPAPSDVRLERLTTTEPGRRQAFAEAAAAVMAEGFGADDALAADLEGDLARTRAPWDACVLFSGDEPVAAGRRYTADGMTYLSSIATRPRWWGRGYGTAITAALVVDGVRDGGELAHLGVEAGNERARGVYERLGFAVLGERVPDLLLR